MASAASSRLARTVAVQLRDGTLVQGELQSVVDASDDTKDMVLGNPYFYDPAHQLLRAEGVRYLYLVGSEIVAVRLSVIAPEVVRRGYVPLPPYEDLRTGATADANPTEP